MFRSRPRSRAHSEFSSAVAALLAATLILPPSALARQPGPETLAAYERYRVLTEARMDADRRAGHFLYFDRFPADRRSQIDAQLRRGEFYLEQLHTLDGDKKIPVPGGLIHHWIGAALIPGATLAQTKAVLEDYENQKTSYYPDVRKSHFISQEGNTRNVFLQFYSKTVVTAVFNVNFASTTTEYSPTQTRIRACSTRVADVEDFGKPAERELAPADSRGYLWQLCTWWNIEEKSGGTYIQVEATELSRTVPFVFAWLVNPIIREVPKTFLSHLLTATRKAVLKQDKEKPKEPKIGLLGQFGTVHVAPGFSPASSVVGRLGSGATEIFDRDFAARAVSQAAEQQALKRYSLQPSSAIFSSSWRASGLPFFDAATSNTCAWSQFFSTPSPRRYRSASVTSAGT